MTESSEFINQNVETLATSISEEVLVFVSDLDNNKSTVPQQLVVAAKINGISTPLNILIEINKLPEGSDYAIKIGDVIVESAFAGAASIIGAELAKKLISIPAIATGAGFVLATASTIGISYAFNHDGEGALEDLIDMMKGNYFVSPRVY
tara:strand:- start:142 stop:591 length:450 start_codon:yes stop_codon:yes gene_type:complete